MKPENYLKKAAKAEQEKILENGGELLASLQAQIPQKKKRRVAVWLSVAATSLALIIAAVCVGVFAFREDEIIYYEENVAFEETDLAELETSCREFSVDPTSIKISSISKAYDSVSGDTLYFELELRKSMNVYMEMIIVCNPNYHYIFQMEPLLLSREIDGYTLSYDFQTKQSGALFRLNGYGKIAGTRETVYILFVQISEWEDDETFFAFIQNTIRKK